MDFQSAMETFAEAWVAATAGAQTQALALTRSKSPSAASAAAAASNKVVPSSTPPAIGSNGNNSLADNNNLAPNMSYNNHNNNINNNNTISHHSTREGRDTNQSGNANNCRDDRGSMITSPKSTSSNHSTRADFSGRESNGNGPSPSSVASSQNLNRDRSHSPPPNIKSMKPLNIKEENESSPHKVPLDTNPNLLAANYFTNSHLKLAENLMSHGGAANFLNANLLHANKNNDMRTSPEKGEDDGGSATPLSTHHPMGGFERKDFDFSKVNARSLPLHCIVESVSTLQSVIGHGSSGGSGGNGSGGGGSGGGSGGSSSAENRGQWKRRSNIETDSYIIVPAVTQFCNIVPTALQRLGYSPEIGHYAKGSIIVKNWKPLDLEKICDNPVITVGDVLGELTSVVTLKISILRTKPSTFTEIKDKLLKLLILQSHAALRSSGCPLDEMTLSQLCRHSLQTPFPFAGEINDEMRRKFDMWWSSQLSPQASHPMTPKMLPFSPSASSLSFSPSEHLARTSEVLLDAQHHSMASHHQSHPNLIVHPALQTVHSQYPSQKTRMRTSFDPEMELPKLQRWFHENPHPSRQQIQSYVIQLNSLESRRGRKPLDVNNVVYWFKNARAAQKRAETRGQGLSNGFGSASHLLMGQANYLKSPHTDDIDNLSQHSDDMDDDMERPVSPQVPLSLTTRERHRSPSVCDDRHMDDAEMNNNDSPAKNQNGGKQEGDEEENNIPLSGSKENSNSHLVTGTDSPKSSKSEDLDMEEGDMGTMDHFRSPSPDSRRDLPFPMVPNSMFSHSIMYMSHYIPQMGQAGHGAPQQSMSPNSCASGLNLSNLSSLSNDERRKRNRTFIDPVTEVPKLEQWFAMNTHPSHNLILKYTEDLNRMPYRQKFPRLESKNVQFWFKNRRAKCKRLKMSLYDTSQLGVLGSFAGDLEDRKMVGYPQALDRD